LVLVAHVIGNSSQPDLPAAVGFTNLLVGLIGVALLMTPQRPLLLLGAALTLISVVAEMPFTGNHWVVAALAGLAILVAAGDYKRFAPALRLVFLVFYAFAAFAKLNAAFFDPSVSCAVFYSNQFLSSWGLSTIAPTSWAARSAVWGTALVELSIVPMLLMRRTRYFAVLLALGFHILISFDLSQHFYDFTAVLLAFLVLFLPEETSIRIQSTLCRIKARALPLMVCLVLAFLVVLATLPLTPGSSLTLASLPFMLWIPISVAIFVSLVIARRPSSRLDFRVSPALSIVVTLALANGLTPYTEIKTAFGFNMYSNLLTANGESNHFLVRSTWPLRNGYEGPAEILSSSDPGLMAYHALDYLVAFPQLRLYLADHPDSAVTYTRHGQTISVKHAADIPELIDPGPWWWRFMPLRAIDKMTPTRCQAVFLSAM
jgi:hypothetical protein